MTEQQLNAMWKWFDAPTKTLWGDDMVVADLAIDKDHTASIYCERDQISKVEAMFTPPVAQPALKPLTDEQVEKIIKANMSIQMNLAGIRQDFEAAHGITGETK